MVHVYRFEVLKVWVRFRFNDFKFKRFRFGSGSPKKAVFTGSRFRFGFGSTPCIKHINSYQTITDTWTGQVYYLASSAGY